MDETEIRKAWNQLERLFGPDYYGRDARLKDKARDYAKAVLDANDKGRIKK